MKNLIISLFVLSFIGCSTSSVQKREEDRSPQNFRTCLDLMMNIMSYDVYHGPSSGTFSTATSFDELEEMYGADSFIEIQRAIPNAEILANNKNIKKLLAQPYEIENPAGRITAVSLKDTQVIYDAMEKSKVNQNHWCYDPEGKTGFCFGRATIAHMEAITRNVHPDAVKKIWIAGDMDFWGHHVATMLYTKKGWRVLDTNNGKPLTVLQWITHYMKDKKKGAEKDIMVYITQAGRFGPYDSRPYSAVDLFNTTGDDFDKASDFFKGYFHDYFEALDQVRNAAPPITPPRAR